MKKLSNIPMLGLAIALFACSGGQKDQTKETISIASLVEEVKTVPDSVIQALNAQHHQLRVLERRSVPGPVNPANMKIYSSHAVKAEDLPVINPGQVSMCM